MKKILKILAIFGLLLALTPEKVRAQNTFKCQWWGDACHTSLSPIDLKCVKPSAPDPRYCKKPKFDDRDSCNNAPATSCVLNIAVPDFPCTYICALDSPEVWCPAKQPEKCSPIKWPFSCPDICVEGGLITCARCCPTIAECPIVTPIPTGPTPIPLPTGPVGTSKINWPELYKVLGGLFASGKSLSLGDIISKLLNYLFPAVGLLLLLYLLYGGFMFLTSGGDPKKAQVAKGILTNAIAGFMIVFVSFWLVQAFAKVLGLTPIRSIFK